MCPILYSKFLCSVESLAKHGIIGCQSKPKGLLKGKKLRLVQVHVAGKGAVKEQELISWDEVKDEKDVYQAVRTADGRQALVRAGGEQALPCPQPCCMITLYQALHSLVRADITCCHQLNHSVMRRVRYQDDPACCRQG